MLSIILLQLKDGGGSYAETNMDNFIVEPWNAFSSIAIALPAIYWAIKTWPHYRKYAFLWISIPFLFLNGVGSLLFHAFRSSDFLLLMDVLPAALLTIGISIYFWYKVINNVVIVGVIIVSALILRFVGFNYLTLSASTNVSYLVAGIVLFLPTIIYLRRTNYFCSFQLIASIVCLIIALVFRLIDKEGLIPLKMGTHFLWHIFSGIGGFFLAHYLYAIRTRELDLESAD